MAKRVAISTLNASTIDILNTIRANASLQYQNLVPEVESNKDIPRVGDIIYGYPALANEFISALVTRIASVRIKSATFNNAYAELKKGYLEFGETVEEAFVQIAKAREFSAEKAEAREFKRTIPDVRTAFHAMNWRVQYPITIQDEDLRTAFLDMSGVQDLIAKIVDSVTTANEYDEYLLFKYLMIKAITKGKMYPVAVDTSDIHNSAKKFRGMSNNLTFMNTKYNASGVHTTTPRDDQYIFMDSEYNAEYDVDVLAGAFNMDKADFIGHLKLIDDWTTFDNDRFDVIRSECDMVEEVTAEELELMNNVVGVICDKEWFQIYDNNYKMTEKYVASGMYWNYFLNVWKTVSSSPFSNAVVFVKDTAPVTEPETITLTVTEKSVSDVATVITLGVTDFENSMADSNVKFIQTEELTENGVAVHKYGAYMFPTGANGGKVAVRLGENEYVSSSDISTESEVGDTFTLSQGEPPTPPEPPEPPEPPAEDIPIIGFYLQSTDGTLETSIFSNTSSENKIEGEVYDDSFHCISITNDGTGTYNVGNPCKIFVVADSGDPAMEPTEISGVTFDIISTEPDYINCTIDSSGVFNISTTYQDVMATIVIVMSKEGYTSKTVSFVVASQK